MFRRTVWLTLKLLFPWKQSIQFSNNVILMILRWEFYFWIFKPFLAIKLRVCKIVCKENTHVGSENLELYSCNAIRYLISLCFNFSLCKLGLIYEFHRIKCDISEENQFFKYNLLFKCQLLSLILVTFIFLKDSFLCIKILIILNNC